MFDGFFYQWQNKLISNIQSWKVCWHSALMHKICSNVYEAWLSRVPGVTRSRWSSLCLFSPFKQCASWSVSLVEWIWQDFIDIRYIPAAPDGFIISPLERGLGRLGEGGGGGGTKIQNGMTLQIQSKRQKWRPCSCINYLPPNKTTSQPHQYWPGWKPYDSTHTMNYMVLSHWTILQCVDLMKGKTFDNAGCLYVPTRT